MFHGLCHCHIVAHALDLSLIQTLTVPLILTRQDGALAENQEVVAALADLARNYVLFAPGTLAQSPALPALVHWAVAAVQLREPEPVSPAAAFLTSLIAPSPQTASSQLWQARPNTG